MQTGKTTAQDPKPGAGGYPDLWKRPAIIATVVLLIPAAGMLFGEGWLWGPMDFVLMGLLVFSAGFTYELVARNMNNKSYRTAVAISVVAGLALVWINLAVGIIGESDHRGNLMYFAALLAGIVGACLVRFRAAGLAWVLFAMAGAHLLIAAVVLLLIPMESPGPVPTAVLSGIFAVIFAGAGLLFHDAARETPAPAHL